MPPHPRNCVVDESISEGNIRNSVGVGAVHHSDPQRVLWVPAVTDGLELEDKAVPGVREDGLLDIGLLETAPLRVQGGARHAGVPFELAALRNHVVDHLLYLFTPFWFRNCEYN